MTDLDAVGGVPVVMKELMEEPHYCSDMAKMETTDCPVELGKMVMISRCIYTRTPTICIKFVFIM